MKIAVDARVIVDSARRGIGKTTLAIYQALAVARPDWTITLICRDEPEPGLFANCPNVRFRRVEMPGDRFDLWRRVRLPLALATARPDVVHAPAGPAPWPLTAPLVTTIYDLIPIDPTPRDAEAARWGESVRAAAHRARVVLTISNYSRERIVDRLGIPFERVAVVPIAPLSVPSGSLSAERRAELASRYGFDAGKRYVLHFGMNDPRKNTRQLLREWPRIPGVVRDVTMLVIVGVQGPALAEFQTLATPGVVVAGYVPERDACDLLAGAALLAYPTTAEGFGLPMVDAFAAGVPVVAGNRTSIPEVAGGAAELIDPDVTGQLADGLTRVLAEAGYADELRWRGLARAAEFTWTASAEGLARVFEQAVTAAPGIRGR